MRKKITIQSQPSDLHDYYCSPQGRHACKYNILQDPGASRTIAIVFIFYDPNIGFNFISYKSTFSLLFVFLLLF